MDLIVIVWDSRLVNFSQRLGNQNMRIVNEMAEYYKDVEKGRQSRDDGVQPRFHDLDCA
jgi:hypothetical protein